ncbi:hypothetical protein [Parasegetibacter sp. NRK P23]|uniref:hypothetical protein n=1 Tax=Parasegetibacter sp. NRK P23 TaxID=2942999 RepID=UPI002042D4AC|nr:hypothetical protein [Parasegetibacter sp. NRK P23]MCM5528987.1 hypothetical protein [Parasegetibacter sp. NRK P23]
MSNNRLELKIKKDANGVDIDLENLSIGTVGTFITFVESLKCIIENSIANDEVRIKITKGSACVSTEVTEDQVIKLQDDFQKVVSNGSLSNPSIFNSWNAIHEIIAANGVEYEVNFCKNDITTSILGELKNKDIFRARRSKRKEKKWQLFFETGRMYAIGGKTKPNFHITRRSDHKELAFHFEERFAANYIKFLYSDVFISAWGYQESDGKYHYQIADVYAEENIYNDLRLFFQQLTLARGEDRLRQIFAQIRICLDDGNFGLLAKILRLLNNDYWNVSDLRTSLLITKSFKQHPKIAELREEIKEKLEKKLGHSIK